jgi:hypothetical protein
MTRTKAKTKVVGRIRIPRPKFPRHGSGVVVVLNQPAATEQGRVLAVLLAWGEREAAAVLRRRIATGRTEGRAITPAMWRIARATLAVRADLDRAERMPSRS